MPKSKPTMTKLAAGRHALALFVSSRQTLWLSGDHLLLQITTGYTERVRSFYFADIQSISYARTGEGTAISIVCAAMAALLVFLGFWNISELGQTAGLSIAALALLPLLGLGFNLLAGPTCACVFSTAVHTERVLALNRIAKVERVLGQILPRIDAAQGRLSADMLAADSSGTDSVEPGVHALEGNAGRVELRHEPGTWHKTTFALCLVLGLGIALDILIQSNLDNDSLDYFLASELKKLLNFTLSVAVMVFAATAAMKQRNSDLPQGVKGLCIAILVLVPVLFVVGMMLRLILDIVEMQSGTHGLLHDSSVTYQAFRVVSTMAFTLAGTFGWLRMRRVEKVPPPFRGRLVTPSEAGDESP